MSKSIDQKAYLMKYLGGSSKTEKKKKKKNVKIKGTGMKIIDDDIDLSKLRELEEDELDLLGDSEDAPQIAGIVDDRPEEVKRSEQFSKEKWKVIAQDDGFNSTLTVSQVSKKIRNNLTNDSNRSDSDLSPPRNFGKDDSDLSPPRSKRKDDSDLSPPRNRESKKARKDEKLDSDLSPPRNRESKKTRKGERSDSDLSPPRNKNREPKHVQKSKKNDSNSDLSPPRNRESKKARKYEKSDSDLSPPRNRESKKARKSEKSDSDLSPPRNRESKKARKYEKSDSDLSPPRNKNREPKHVQKSKKNDSDSDLSPPRSKNISKSQHNTRNPDSSARKNNSKHKNDKNNSDLSPPRKNRRDDSKQKRKTNSDSDLSPERPSKKTERKRSRWGDPDDELGQRILEDINRNKNNTTNDRNGSGRRSRERNSDKNEPDRFRNRSDREDDRYGRKKYDERSKESSRNDGSRGRRDDRSDLSKMEKTLDGKMAGLQNARQLVEENREFKRREAELFDNLSEEASGRNAQVVKRNLKGKRETEEDRQIQKEKEEKQKEIEAKYHKWGKGLKQVEEQEANIRDYMHEASKPLARHRDDRDLEDSLRHRERDGDPMLEYMRKKETERGTQEGLPVRPVYKGPYPPNRYNIRPGHRWDGVDRSNGHEKAVFQAVSSRKAMETEQYKWSTEDM